MASNKTSPSKKRRFEQYKANHTREKNKIRKIKKHLKRHPNNTIMHERIKALEAIIGNK